MLGVVIGAFSVSAIVLRPWVGREVDRRGRKLFTALGIGLSAVSCLAYSFTDGLAGLIAVRLLHGSAIACFYTAASAFAADLAPESRRGEAISYFSTVLYAGSAIGPLIGEFLVAEGGFLLAFRTAALIGLLGFGLSLILDEPPRERLPREKSPLLHRGVTFPALVLMLAAPCWAALSFVPLYLEGSVGASGLFFLALSITVLGVRPLLGRVSDRLSRGTIILPGIALTGLSMAALALGASRPAVISAAILFGVGWGALWPGLLSLSIDLVPESQRGSATGTFTAAFDLSFGLGSALLGFMLESGGFEVLFAAAGLGALASFVVFLSGKGRIAVSPAEAA